MDVRKKTLHVDQARIDRVRKALGARTDTDAIHGALNWVLESQAVIDDLMAVAGKGRGRLRPSLERPAKPRRRA